MMILTIDFYKPDIFYTPHVYCTWKINGLIYKIYHSDDYMEKNENR